MRYLFLMWLYFCSIVSMAQISGRVWQGQNSNSKTDAYEPSVGATQVSGYNTAGQLIAQTTTASDGSYQLSVPPGQATRVEFGALSNGWQSTSYSHSIHFVTSPAEVNLSVYRPTYALGTNLRLVQAVYVNGNYSSAEADSLAAVVMTTAKPAQSPPTRIATPRQVGSLWGLAYDRTSQHLYGAALAKRHAGFGPLGAGGIYRLLPQSRSVQPFINLDALGFPTAPDNLKRDLSGSITGVSHDSLMFGLVGKCSLGGLDITEDGQTLYVMNLYDRTLYAIRLPQDGATPQATDVKKYILPAIAGSGGTIRPFAVKIYNDLVYVGAVTDASQSKQPADLKAIVYAFDPAPGGQTFNEIFSTPLNYTRGTLDYGVSGWLPWTDDYRQAIAPSTTDWLIYPQPMLADIEFDVDGSMILGLMDRLGHQTGDGQLFRPVPGGQLMPYRGLSGGDVLRVSRRNGHYELERNGRAGLQQSLGRNNRQGPTGGEFYEGDGFMADGIVWHQETATGGLALLPDSGQVVVAAREPVPGQYTTGGMRWLSNRTGAYVRGQAAFPGASRAGYFWKTNNVGDVEVIAESPSLTIGDRVWQDRNANGQQDADEPGLANVQLHLYQDRQLVGTTQTDQAGYYTFDAQSVKEGILPRTAYEIRLPLTGQTDQSGLGLPQPAQRREVATGLPGEIDNDAVLAGQTAIVRLTTGTAGVSLHDLDFGLSCSTCPNAALPAEPQRLILTPNPVATQAQVQYRGYQTADALTLSVLDTQGKGLLTITGVLTDGHFSQTLNLTGWSSGAYIVSIQEGDYITTAHLIKQ